MKKNYFYTVHPKCGNHEDFIDRLVPHCITIQWWIMCKCKQQQVNIKFYMKQWRSQSTKKNYCYIVHPKCGSHEDFLWFKYLMVQFTSMQQKVLHEPMKISINKEVLLLYCTSQMWKSWRIFTSQTTNGALYLKATERKFYSGTIIKLWKSNEKAILEGQEYSMVLHSELSYKNCLLHLSLVMFPELMNTKVL